MKDMGFIFGQALAWISLFLGLATHWPPVVIALFFGSIIALHLWRVRHLRSALRRTGLLYTSLYGIGMVCLISSIIAHDRDDHPTEHWLMRLSVVAQLLGYWFHQKVHNQQNQEPGPPNPAS